MAREDLTGVILAGGRATRMGGVDKGLVAFCGRPMVEHVMERLRPQCGQLVISANRSLEAYSSYGYMVLPDASADFRGPLAGACAAFAATATPWIVTAPCDCPFIPADYALRLVDAAEKVKAACASVRVLGKTQPVFALISRSLAGELSGYVAGGGHRVGGWLAANGVFWVDFEDEKAFRNLNTARELAEAEAS